MYKLSLAHICPNLLNFYGDSGNVVALKKRCEWRGISLDVVEVNEKECIPAEHDVYFIGGSSPQCQTIAAKWLIENKSALKSACDSGAVIFAISEGLQLLGNYYQYKNQEKVEGLGILDIYSVEDDDKFVGNVTAECDLVNPKEIVGFENHTMKTYLNNEKPLSKVIIGQGNNKSDKTEGVRKNNLFGTYLHGPFLPKNPHFTDYLIGLALEKKYGKKINLETLNDEIELNTYKKLAGKKY